MQLSVFYSSVFYIKRLPNHPINTNLTAYMEVYIVVYTSGSLFLEIFIFGHEIILIF